MGIDMMPKKTAKGLYVVVTAFTSSLAITLFATGAASQVTADDLSKEAKVAAKHVVMTLPRRPSIVMKLKKIETQKGGFQRVKIDAGVNYLHGNRMTKQLLNLESPESGDRIVASADKEEIGSDSVFAIAQRDLGDSEFLEVDMTVKYEKGTFTFPSVYTVRDAIRLSSITKDKPAVRSYRLRTGESEDSTTLIIVEYVRK